MNLGVGEITTGVLATVDGKGGVDATACGRAVSVGWRIQAANRWIDPASEPSLRQTRAGAAPIAQTSVRVPGGDAVQRVYALGSHGGVVVIEVENASPQAIAAAFVVRGGDAERVLTLPRRPGAVEADGAVVFPVPHRATVRVALAPAEIDVRELADAPAVARGWERVLERGMRTELPDALQARVDAARADALLAAPSAAAFVALEDWGFDREAGAMWERLATSARRAARRRSGVDTGVLGTTRDALVRASGRAVEVLPGFSSEWLGQNLAVHDAPVRRGLVSFALRWHGPRPALLWDVPPGAVVRAPALDADWSSAEPAGETLLAEPVAVS